LPKEKIRIYVGTETVCVDILPPLPVAADMPVASREQSTAEHSSSNFPVIMAFDPVRFSERRRSLLGQLRMREEEFVP
jgi:hypothetical protein